MVASGVWLAGRATTGQPAARAGAILRAWRRTGKFQGAMLATTPTGCFSVQRRLFGRVGGMISP